MATNNFKPFGIGSNANVTAQADYEALSTLISGFQSGKASSAQINKALRQGTVMASVLAQFISNATGEDVLDDGETATVLTNLIAALNENAADNFLQIGNNFSEIKAAGASALATALTNLGLSDAAHLPNFVAISSGNGYEQRPVMVGGVQKTLVRQWGFALSTSTASGTTIGWSSTLPLAITTLLGSMACPANGAIGSGVTVTVNDIGTPYTGTNNNLPATSVSSISGVVYNNSGATTKIGIRWECVGFL